MSGYTAGFTCDREDRMSTPNSDSPTGWLTTDEVAEMAGCSADTVLRAIKADEIGEYRITGGRIYLIPAREGIRWANKYRPYGGLRKREEDTG